MTVCANRTDSPGFFTSCWDANGRTACLCGAAVAAESDARGEVDQNHTDVIPGRQIGSEGIEGAV